MSQNSFYTQVKKQGNSLSYKKGYEELFAKFLSDFPEGTVFDLYVSQRGDRVGLATLAKIHAVIRELANHTGNTVKGIKLYLKDEAGLCHVYEENNEEKLDCISFAEVSQEQMNLVFEAARELGNKVGLHLNI